MLFESEFEAVPRYLLAKPQSEHLCGINSHSQDSLEAINFTLNVRCHLDTRLPGYLRCFSLLILPFLSCLFC